MGEQQQPPSYSRYASELMNMPPEKITGKTALDLAIQKGFPRPSEAADAVMKIVDSDRKRLKESLPNQPTGTTPLDVPMANMIRDVSGLDYLQAAPIQAPLGMQGNLPMTIQDIIPMLPPDYQLPSPIQGQQPELSLFGPGERKGLVDVGERKDMLQNFKTSFEGAKTSLGPAQGRLKYLQYVKGGGIGLSAAEISYFANEATITNRVIKLITGAAVGVKEEKRIMSEIPRHTDTPAQWA